jgi:hypothetical protein
VYLVLCFESVLIITFSTCLIRSYAESQLSRGVDEIATSNSLSVVNCNRYFVTVTVTAENPVSHGYFVTKSNDFRGMFPRGKAAGA